jgi:hypothetical protein
MITDERANFRKRNYEQPSSARCCVNQVVQANEQPPSSALSPGLISPTKSIQKGALIARRICARNSSYRGSAGELAHGASKAQVAATAGNARFAPPTQLGSRVDSTYS